MRRSFLALIASALYIVGVVYASLTLLKPQRPPELPKASVVHSALTQHLLFVVVDGLRYDVATDPSRMPHFAEAMRNERSADILAGPVSMTSSAVLSFGSGQRGRLEQIARNINPAPPPFESWMQNALERGLKVSLVGDRTWIEMYGHHFSETYPDPPGVAIDYDYNDQTFRDARLALSHAPNAMILHFVTPDHQGHAYGVQSERYAKHIFNFDRLLAGFLGEVGPEWTVVVTSDHGASDTGDHGGDVLVHRRSPIFAYGPGIAPPAGPKLRLDQVDVAGTLSALLGVPAPCHSQGHLLVNWLALSDAERAHLAVNDVARGLTFARALDAEPAQALGERLRVAHARLASDPAQLIVEAEQLARETDHLLRSQQGVFSPRAWWSLAAITVGAALVAWLLVGPIPLSTALLSILIALISIALTAGVERLPGDWPKLSAGIVFGVCNLPTLLLLLRPERFLALLERCGPYASALVPGILAVTYPRNLQPEGCVLALVVPLVVLAAGSLARWGVSEIGSARRGRRLDLAVLAVCWVLLLPGGWFPDGLTGLGWSVHTQLLLTAAVASIGVFAFELARRVPGALREIAWLSLAVVVCLVIRRVAPPWLGRSALLLLPLLALWPLLRGRIDLALLCLLGAYVWVSRDMEVLSVTATAGIASLVGRRCAHLVHERGRWLTLLGFWFCLAYVLRVGVSGGIDPTHLDLSAGAFGDKAVAAGWVGFCLVWKNLIALTLLGLAFLWAFPAPSVAQLARGFAVISACRAAVLLAMMQLAQGSFWTSMRVVGELPYIMIFLASAGSVWFLRRLAFAHDREPLSDSAIGESRHGRRAET